MNHKLNPSAESRYIAEKVLASFSAPYFALDPKKIEARKRIIMEAASAIDADLNAIQQQALRRTDVNPT